MQKETFEKAIEITKELDSYRKHKEELLSSQILNGGGLIFTYNSHYKDVVLIGDLYGKSEFFKIYMENLDKKIQGLEQNLRNFNRASHWIHEKDENIIVLFKLSDIKPYKEEEV